MTHSKNSPTSIKRILSNVKNCDVSTNITVNNAANTAIRQHKIVQATLIASHPPVENSQS